MLKRLIVILLALLPSIWAVYQSGGMPHLGAYHDDGIYVGTARAIADGKGPRIESFPGEPFQVKYPPLYPLYLAAGVRSEWSLAILVWLTLPFLLYQVWRWRGDAVMVILLGWNVFSVLISGMALTEVISTALLVCSIRWFEQDRIRGAAAVAGAAYLVRTAMIALPAATLLWLVWKRRWRDIGVYCVVFAPFALAWSAYTQMYSPANVQGEAIYYLSYGKFFRANMDAGILPVVMSINATAIFHSLGSLLFFNLGESFWDGNFARLLFLASGSGLVRAAKRSGVGVYLLFAAVHLAMLMVWNFPADERFVYPLLPLLLDGILIEARHFCNMLKVTWKTQPTATFILGALAGLGAFWAVERNAISIWYIPRGGPMHAQAQAPKREEVYAWIRGNMDPGSTFIVHDDPGLRRATGMHGFRLHCPTRFRYLNDLPALTACFQNVVEVMRREGVPNIVMGPDDYEEFRPEVREKLRTAIAAHPDLETIFDNTDYVIRVLRPGR